MDGGDGLAVEAVITTAFVEIADGAVTKAAWAGARLTLRRKL
jgi:hypothetical protein